ncbi:MAG: hypothetical protein ACRCUY_06630 [Thermoguttaceae bacterium]
MGLDLLDIVYRLEKRFSIRIDRSVRADGLPYTPEEILQGVTEALCEALAVEPEKVTLDAGIIKDLGAE